MKENSNGHYIDGLKAGDRQVFSQIFDAHYEALCRYAVQRTHSQELAEELVQDIFVKLWIRRKNLTIQSSISAYLYRATLNAIINHQKHKEVQAAHRAHTIALHKDTFEPSSTIAEKEIQLLAAQAIEKMPPKRKEVYELSRHDGLKYAEIAEKMDISIKTVEVHLSKALQHMRNELKDYLPICFLLMMQSI